MMISRILGRCTTPAIKSIHRAHFRRSFSIGTSQNSISGLLGNYIESNSIFMDAMRTNFKKLTTEIDNSKVNEEEIGADTILAATRLAMNNAQNEKSAYFLRILYNLVPGSSSELAGRVLGALIYNLDAKDIDSFRGSLLMIVETINHVKGHLSDTLTKELEEKLLEQLQTIDFSIFTLMEKVQLLNAYFEVRASLRMNVSSYLSGSNSLMNAILNGISDELSKNYDTLKLDDYLEVAALRREAKSTLLLKFGESLRYRLQTRTEPYSREQIAKVLQFNNK